MRSKNNRRIPIYQKTIALDTNEVNISWSRIVGENSSIYDPDILKVFLIGSFLYLSRNIGNQVRIVLR